MRSVLVSVALAVAAIATPVFAQTTFYIVQDTSTKRCTIVQERPTVQTSIVVGGDRVFTTRAEAENAIRTIEVCKSN